MARGTGITTAMIKSIDWSHKKTVIIVVCNIQQKDYIRELLRKELGDILPRKAIVLSLHEARRELLGRSADDVYIDHAVYDVQSDGLKEELYWLNIWMKAATGRSSNPE